MHHWSDGCRCCGGLRAHVTGKSCFGSPSLPAARTEAVEVRHPAICRRWRKVAIDQNPTFDHPPRIGDNIGQQLKATQQLNREGQDADRCGKKEGFIEKPRRSRLYAATGRVVQG